jgi:hypothetical protein
MKEWTGDLRPELIVVTVLGIFFVFAGLAGVAGFAWLLSP